MGDKVGEVVIAGVGEGDGVKFAVYLPLSHTKYAASKTIIKIITTIVTFLLKLMITPLQAVLALSILTDV